MIRNDYRRALIMLRSLTGSHSGHVRLERRTLNGTMQFTVNGAQGDAPMQGVLLAEKNGYWQAHPLGQLQQDRHDQMGLHASFDPRNLGGRELEDYDLVGVLRPDDPENPLVLSGYLNGSREVDWQRVRDACNRLTRGGTSETVMSLPEEGQSVPAFEPRRTVKAQPQPKQAVASEEAEETEESQPQVMRVPVAEQPETPVQPKATVQSVGFSVEPQQPAAEAAEPPAIESMPKEAVWPERILSLRVLFETSPCYEPFAAKDYVFVRAPLPSEEDANAHCAVGLKTVRGEYSVLCYAVPGTFALEPPPGLEGYSWRGTGSEGWWTTCIDLMTGEPYEGDDP